MFRENVSSCQSRWDLSKAFISHKEQDGWTEEFMWVFLSSVTQRKYSYGKVTNHCGQGNKGNVVWLVVSSILQCWHHSEWANTRRLFSKFNSLKSARASLVAQWLRICLPMQGTRVRALVWEDPICRGATRPVSHNYWACASGACAPQQERPRQWEARAPRWRVAPTCRN